MSSGGTSPCLCKAPSPCSPLTCQDPATTRPSRGRPGSMQWPQVSLEDLLSPAILHVSYYWQSERHLKLCTSKLSACLIASQKALSKFDVSRMHSEHEHEILPDFLNCGTMQQPSAVLEDLARGISVAQRPPPLTSVSTLKKLFKTTHL